MARFTSADRFACTAWFVALTFCSSSKNTVAADTRVDFDLPSSIECRDVTPADFAAQRPTMKVIEAKVRISARVAAGKLADVVDFVYLVESPDRTLKFHDYLPNTTLESTIADDQIEITASVENTSAAGAEAHVVYKPVDAGGSLNQSSKSSQCSKYRQIASKELVLASGTTNREHGVFFRLRPSRTSSLEGAKEFTLLATVPKSWRGDLCDISCAAKAQKRTLISTSVAPAGAVHMQIGMYLAGDSPAAAAAEALRQAQESYAAALTAPPTKENVFETISNQAVGLVTSKKPESVQRKKQQEAHAALVEAEEALRALAN